MALVVMPSPCPSRGGAAAPPRALALLRWPALVAVSLSAESQPAAGATARYAAVGGFNCTSGITIANSDRATAAASCPSPAAAGTECAYACDPGYLPIGRHVCQNYSTMGMAVIDQAFFGGRCEKLCGGAVAAGCGSGSSLVPVRMNTSTGCLSTTCLPPAEALGRLARGNYEVWKLGRNRRTGMYFDHVDPALRYELQPSRNMASADSAGPGLAIECVAAALGYTTVAEAAARVLLTLRSFAGKTARFADSRNTMGWLPTFMDPDTGRCLAAPTIGCEFSTDSTALNTAGVLFAKTFFERVAPGAAATAQISALAEELFQRVRWAELFCSAQVGLDGLGSVTTSGPWIPWLYNATNGCKDSFGPAADGLYIFSEMHWLVWLAHASVCEQRNRTAGGAPGPPRPGCDAAEPVEQLWRNWEGRAAAPNYFYAGNALLTLWPSYVVQLPYYLVHPFNSDPRFVALFENQWRSEWAYYNSSSLNAGERGRYGSGAGPTAAWCAGTGYKADLITNDTVSQSCRMYSPYSVAGYTPAEPATVRGHLLELLASGEAVLPVNGTDTYVLWRKSMLDPSWSPVPSAGAGRDPGYGITLVDFAAELFGLSTLWLGAGFYQNMTDHWPRR
eukprot:SAG22_NODE_129_length_18679_cov_40.656028_15_plen_620_part_00